MMLKKIWLVGLSDLTESLSDLKYSLTSIQSSDTKIEREEQEDGNKASWLSQQHLLCRRTLLLGRASSL